MRNNSGKYIRIAAQLLARVNQYGKNVNGIKYSFDKLAIIEEEFIHHFIG